MIGISHTYGMSRRLRKWSVVDTQVLVKKYTYVEMMCCSWQMNICVQGSFQFYLICYKVNSIEAFMKIHSVTCNSLLFICCSIICYILILNHRTLMNIFVFLLTFRFNTYSIIFLRNYFIYSLNDLFTSSHRVLIYREVVLISTIQVSLVI
jgi:hypothetical protein